MILLADGRVAAEGPPQALRDSRDELVHQYVNSLPDGPVEFHYPRVPIEQDLEMLPGPR